jgi:hypothetical protein
MGAFEDAQRRNIEKQLKAGNITQAAADAARAGIDRASGTGGVYIGGGNVQYNSNKGSSKGTSKVIAGANFSDRNISSYPAGGIVPGWRADMPYGSGGNEQPPLPEIPLAPEIPAEQTVQPDITEYINELKEAERRARIAALEKARTTALTGLETEKANIAPVYYDKRNQAAAASDVSAMNFAQYAAARGIKGAAGAMPEIYRQAGLQGQIGALDRAEANALANIERQRSGIESSYASDVAAAEADVESNAMQALIDQWNTNRQYELQKAALTGNLGDTRTLAGLEFDYSKSPSNPAVQAAILANRARELENTAKEIQNSYLPQTLKLEAQRLEQQVKAGSLDYDTALAQLNQIKAQTARYLSDANSGGSGGLTAYQQAQLDSREEQELWNRAVELAKNDQRLNTPSDTAANTFDQLVDAYYKQLVAQKYGGASFY